MSITKSAANKLNSLSEGQLCRIPYSIIRDIECENRKPLSFPLPGEINYNNLTGLDYLKMELIGDYIITNNHDYSAVDFTKKGVKMSKNLALAVTIRSNLVPGARRMLDRHGIGSLVNPLEDDTSEIHVKEFNVSNVRYMIKGYLESLDQLNESVNDHWGSIQTIQRQDKAIIIKGD